MTATHRIKEVREKTRDESGRKLSGIAIARKLGITPQYYYDIEKGDRNLSAEFASQIADILHVSVDYLLKKTDNPSSEVGSMNNVELELNTKILAALRLLIDDEGYFYEDLREDIFHAIDKSGLYMAYAYHSSSDHEMYLQQFRKYFSSIDDYSDSQSQEMIKEYNIAYCFRTLKIALSNIRSFETKEIFLKLIEKVIIDHNIKTTPDPFSNEREFYNSVLELSDQEIKDKFTFKIDGRELTEEEYKRMVAAVRLERLLQKD